MYFIWFNVDFHVIILSIFFIEYLSIKGLFYFFTALFKYWITLSFRWWWTLFIINLHVLKKIILIFLKRFGVETIFQHHFILKLAKQIIEAIFPPFRLFFVYFGEIFASWIIRILFIRVRSILTWHVTFSFLKYYNFINRG